MKYFFVSYLVIWASLGILSFFRIRTKSIAVEKKRCFDRFVITLGILVTVSMCGGALAWRQPVLALVFLGVGGLIIFLNLRYTQFCEACGKSSQTRYCARCGTNLR